MSVFRVTDYVRASMFVDGTGKRVSFYAGDLVMVLTPPPREPDDGVDFICECIVLTRGAAKVFVRYGHLVDRSRQLSPLEALALAGCPGMPAL